MSISITVLSLIPIPTKKLIYTICCSRILHHFNTTQDDYSVIFTSGCTAALKLVAESFNFESGNRSQTSSQQSTSDISSRVSTSSFAYLDDNHTSVIGMREIIKQRQFPDIACVSVNDVAHWLTTSDSKHRSSVNRSSGNHLFVYPAQSNFCARKYPLDWITGIQSLKADGRSDADWYVLLDAAGFVSTSDLNLRTYHPDFVPLSFYKMFGFPTGIGR